MRMMNHFGDRDDVRSALYMTEFVATRFNREAYSEAVLTGMCYSAGGAMYATEAVR